MSGYLLRLCLARMRHRRHLGKQRLQHKRRGNAGHHDQQDNRREIDGIDDADLQPLLGHDQGDLAAGHHADTDLERIAPVEAADLGRQTAADDLGQQGHQNKADAEQENFRRQAADVGFQTDAGEKHGGKDDIVADVNAALDIRCVLHRAKNDARNVRAGNIGNAEVLLSDVGHGKAESNADDGDALGMGVAGVQPLHHIVDDKADADSNQEEERRLDQHTADAGTLARAGAQHAGQHNDADDIINDRRADNGRAEEAFQVAQLLQRGHRDRYAGGRHDRADEQRAVKLRAAHGRKAIECAVEQRAAHQRHKNADTGDEGRNRACAQQLLQVCAKAGRKHQQHNADLRKGRDCITGLHQIQKAGSDKQTGKDLAHDLRGLAFTGDQRKELCAQDNDRQISKNGIHEISSLLTAW